MKKAVNARRSAPRGAAKSAAKPKDSSPKLSGLLELLDTLEGWLERTALAEVEVDYQGQRVRLRKAGSDGTMMVAAAAPAAALAKAAAPATAAEMGETFKAPLVGTFYAASSPDAAPFVQVGMTVKEGQVVGIIEAMKTMNQMTADRAGTVTQILVKNGQAVEYGQPLFVIA
ncbi:MAG: acetyl-CoA carboxylase biotin carboxyl carrier protein [Alphaproteobacteria bacterium]|nr:acetyl-CoA carboxylase biotin carboxyl carrier protein [Alphaproteobacteria bacterium]